jgi:uncharacterized protein YdhG (YjbR/CyaY superfamily)
VKSLRKARTKPRTIPAYLSRLPRDQRAALERLRVLLHAVVPGAEQCISYGVPAFRLDGKVLVWFAAAPRHCSFFPGAVVADFARELKDFSTSKGTVRFQADHPLPAVLVRKLVKARIARIAAKSSSTGTKLR